MLPIGSPITPEMKSENVGIIGEGAKVVNEEPNSPRRHEEFERYIGE